MSVFMITFAGIMPFGNLIAGILAQTIGVSFAVATGGILCLGFFIVVTFKYPDIIKIC
jgi:hypothetical protein